MVTPRKQISPVVSNFHAHMKQESDETLAAAKVALKQLVAENIQLREQVKQQKIDTNRAQCMLEKVQSATKPKLILIDGHARSKFLDATDNEKRVLLEQSDKEQSKMSYRARKSARSAFRARLSESPGDITVWEDRNLRDILASHLSESHT
jgi:hypothetical protein